MSPREKLLLTLGLVALLVVLMACQSTLLMSNSEVIEWVQSTPIP